MSLVAGDPEHGSTAYPDFQVHGSPGIISAVPAGHVAAAVVAESRTAEA